MIEQLKTVAAWIIAASFIVGCLFVLALEATELAGKITLVGLLFALAGATVLALLCITLVWSINRVMR